MRALTQDSYGWDALEVRDVPDPLPGAGQVLIRVHAAGVNPYDWHYAAGQPLIARPMMGGLGGPRPTVRGADVSGIVVAAGPGVTTFAPGDEVFGFGAGGTFAELALAGVDRIARRPPEFTHVEAAALPMAAVTALQFLRAAGLTAGQRLAITGAGGGIGHFAVQIATAWGAHVDGSLQHAATPRWCASSAPPTSSTTPARTSPPATGASTSSSRTPAGTRCGRSGGWWHPAGSSSPTTAARTACSAPCPTWWSRRWSRGSGRTGW